MIYQQLGARTWEVYIFQQQTWSWLIFVMERLCMYMFTCLYNVTLTNNFLSHSKTELIRFIIFFVSFSLTGCTRHGSGSRKIDQAGVQQSIWIFFSHNKKSELQKCLQCSFLPTGGEHNVKFGLGENMGHFVQVVLWW